MKEVIASLVVVAIASLFIGVGLFWTQHLSNLWFAYPAVGMVVLGVLLLSNLVERSVFKVYKDPSKKDDEH